MSFVTTQPEMLAWATEKLQGVHRDAPSRRGRDTTNRILTTSQLARHSASPRRLTAKRTYSTGVRRVSMNHRGVGDYQT